MSTSAKFQRKLDKNHADRIRIPKNKRESVDFNPMLEFLSSEKKVKTDADNLTLAPKNHLFIHFFQKRSSHRRFRDS